MPRVKDDKDKKRNLILQAAEKVFSEKGYEETAMIDIANEADLGKGTLYLYFSSKKDIYFALVSKELLLIEELIIEKTKDCKNGWEKSVKMAEAYVHFYYQYPMYYDFVAGYEATEANEHEADPNVRNAYNYSKKIFDYLVMFIREGIKDGSIRDDIDPVKTAIVFWAQTTGLMQQLKLRERIFKNWANIEPSAIIDYNVELSALFLKSQL